MEVECDHHKERRRRRRRGGVRDDWKERVSQKATKGLLNATENEAGNQAAGAVCLSACMHVHTTTEATGQQQHSQS